MSHFASRLTGFPAIGYLKSSLLRLFAGEFNGYRHLAQLWESHIFCIKPYTNICKTLDKNH